MFTRPAGLPDTALVDALAAAWELPIASLEYRPVGFGSHHWHATDTDDRAWFLTVDDLEAKRHADDEDVDTVFERLRAALTTAHDVRDAGASFVVAPLPARDGAVARRITARYALALYPYLDGRTASGEYASVADRSTVLTMLVTLHATPRTRTPDAHVDDFGLANLDDLVRALDALAGPWDSGPYAEPARALLDKHGHAVVRALEHYAQLAAEARDRPDRIVLTHGEPHVENVLVTAAGMRLIDWDTALIAPPERDIWMLDPGDGTITAAYTRATGTPVLASMLELYRLRWDLAEIATYVMQFHASHGDDADAAESWKNLQLFLDPTRWSTPG
jgi:hypothetical protein